MEEAYTRPLCVEVSLGPEWVVLSGCEALLDAFCAVCYLGDVTVWVPWRAAGCDVVNDVDLIAMIEEP
jgi:hypothetical protein